MTPGAGLRAALRPLTGGAEDYQPLLELVGDARLVLLGEATHGTHEFYRERARISRLLIERMGFTVVAVEADWPDAYRVNRWVRGGGEDGSATESLDSFERFPRWMWRNRDVLAFVEWLREHNAAAPRQRRVGFYGLDLYSLYGSAEAVIRYLDQVDPPAAERARRRYACFDHFGEDSQAYGYAAEFGLSPSCEDAVVAQLGELQRRAAELSSRDGRIPEDEYFYAEQNARLVRDAEEYYRSMFRGRISSWNLRDRHMAGTLDALLGHFDAGGGPARAVVWAHNSHLGDARATSMGWQGEWNVGQLVRERYRPEEAVLVGFTTHHGTVTAAPDWDHAPALVRVRPALAGSVEALFHELRVPDFLLPLHGSPAAETLAGERLERAIGVVYRPQTERVSHYFEARVADQFDAVIHFDLTRGVEPLDSVREWSEVAAEPETYPTGF